MAALGIRRVGAGDIRLIWQWANDTVTRQMSFNQDPIPWKVHQEWFASKMKDPNCIWYLLKDPTGKAVAQARFDLTASGEAVVNVSVARGERGKGYGFQVVKTATLTLLQEAPNVRRAVAYIRRGNLASMRSFAKAGYVCAHSAGGQNSLATTMIFERLPVLRVACQSRS